jgi:hypothetical protein
VKEKQPAQYQDAAACIDEAREEDFTTVRIRDRHQRHPPARRRSAGRHE